MAARTYSWHNCESIDEEQKRFVEQVLERALVIPADVWRKTSKGYCVITGGGVTLEIWHSENEEDRSSLYRMRINGQDRMTWSFAERRDATYHVTKEGYDAIARLYDRVHLTYRKEQGTLRYEEDLKRVSRINGERQQREEILRRM